MAQKTQGYTHRDKFSGYMQVVADVLGTPNGQSRRVLDMPAGAGHLGDLLRSRGYDVTSADFNRDRADYVFVDMNRRLPFDDATFDVITCLEGIEHVLEPFHLVGELARVCRPGGRVVISTPNITNFYSRLCFLLTGTFFMFNPASLPHVKPGEELDRGHISPVSLQQMQYTAEYHGLKLADVRTDKFKRKPLLPVYAALEALGRPIKRVMFGRYASNASTRDRNDRLRGAMSSPATLFGRTLICVFEKSQAGDR
jgi:SAM-dependent methyltransferase